VSELPASPDVSSAPDHSAIHIPHVRSWLVTTLSICFAYLIVSNGLFTLAPLWQIAIFVGALAVLIAATPWQAAIVAPGVCATALLAAPPALPGHAPLTFLEWLLAVVLTAATAMALGRLRSRVADRPHTFTVAVSAALILGVLVSLWAPLLASGRFDSYGSMKASTIRAVPQPGHYVNDDAIYRSVFYDMHDGQPYYESYIAAWLGLKHKPPLPAAVVAYRLPTMYWLWNLLPRDAFLIEIVFLAFASIGSLAAAAVTAQLVGFRFAPLASAALAAYAMGSAMTVYVTYIDLPATSIALVGIALFVRATITGRTRYLWAAAAVLTVAALTREILVYLMLLAAISVLFAPDGRRLPSLAPWIAALSVFFLGYLAHDLAVQSVLHATSNTLSYVNGSPAFALDALRRFSNVMQGGGALLPVLFVMGLIGALGAGKRTGRVFVIFAIAALAIPLLGMTRLGNPGIDAAGQQVNYWGNLFVPLALALWPAWTLVLPGPADGHGD
jgi:hypothetical protein